MRKRVAITGMGAVTPLGHNVADTWKALCAGKSGGGPITLFNASSFPTKIAGEIKNFSGERWMKSNAMLGRNSLFALEAADEAMRDSGLASAKTDATRFGVYFGAGDGGFNLPQYASIISDSIEGESSSSVDTAQYFKNYHTRTDVRYMLEEEPFQVINHLSKRFGALGPVSNCLTACAASSQAIGEAAETIRAGYTDVMMTGGSHSMIHPLGVAGFNLLTALSTQNAEPERASKPFDKNRDGFLLAEGAGVLILEEWEHAKKRGAHIYAELIGYGGTADAFRLTDPHQEGRGAIQAMRLALKDAGVSVNDIGYINAHGTSTQLNDQIETFSVKQVFGERAYKTPMSSIKSMLGHMIAAAGVTEIIASVLTMRDSIIPPTINYRTPDENCDLDYVPNQARKQAVGMVLSNSFGFGGQNIALIVKKPS